MREFYDRVGWQMVSGEVYQNAEYEDLRPVSRDYIHKCHLRINRHLAPEGDFLLDAGSGPVQYPEYLTYSEGYKAGYVWISRLLPCEKPASAWARKVAMW